MEAPSSLEVFIDDAEGLVGIGLIVNGPSIVEDENGDLVVGCKLSADGARRLIRGLEDCLAAL